MAGVPKRRRRAAISGVYTTAQSQSASSRYGLSYALEAITGALAEANLGKRDIQGLYAAIDGWPQLHGPSSSRYDATNWATLLGVPLRWLTGSPNSGNGSGVSALLDAAAAIESGYIDTAVIAAGMSAHRPGATAPWTVPTDPLTDWLGSFSAAQFALVARRYMHVYGATVEQFAAAASTIRNYGSINPDAVFSRSGPYSVQDILDAPMVADPLTRLMCAPANNGGAAIVVTTLERARDGTQAPVVVLGGADQAVYPAYAEAPLLEHPAGGPFPTRWVDDAFGRSEVSRDDVDVVQLYDSFAPWVLMQWELLGYCLPGEGGAFVESGVMAVDGRWPTCTDGGCSSFSDFGVPAILRPIEAVRQLRGQVADDCPGWRDGVHTHRPGQCRQARDPRVGLAVGMGPPTGGGQLVIVAKDR